MTSQAMELNSTQVIPPTSAAKNLRSCFITKFVRSPEFSRTNIHAAVNSAETQKKVNNDEKR